MSRSFAIITLGCKLNFSESSTIAREFESHGYIRTAYTKAADLYIVNSCSVTEHADKKCRQHIRQLHRINPEAVIVVTGCFAQLKSKEVSEIEGVNIVVGIEHKGEIYSIVHKYFDSNGKFYSICNTSTFTESQRDNDIAVYKQIFSCNITDVNSVFPAYSQGDRTRSFLKIQDGCDYRCSYCTIPLARGASRNLPIELLVKQGKEIAAKGVKEIVLTGVNTGDFGRTTGESLLDLLKALNEIEGIERYRISSIEPNLLTHEIIEWIASGTKFQPHFHIPLQCGSDAVLAKMRRRYNTTMFASKIDMIREIMGDVFFGIDVIAGFPAETDECFEECYNFLAERIRPAFIHVFPYSMRADTPAALMPQVQDCIKTRRTHRLLELCDRLYAEYVARFKGTTQKVLFESTQKGGMMYGYTGNYIKVERPYDRNLISRIVEVKL